ncbi:hypothetical protein AB0C69_24060 [Actinomadura sp. NPDC048032]|uniref:hypothetical protein n=1 Tax=Actinomadura TaxID=1988 RepID=UPI0031E8CE5D
MSFPLRRYIVEAPEGPEQVLRKFAMEAGETHAGLRREVGGPGRPLTGASSEACRRFETLIDGLGLLGVFPQPEAVVRTATGPDHLAHAGYRSGGDDVKHWWIGGDLDHALKTAPKVITLLVGAGSLRGRRRPVARMSTSGVPLESLASGWFLALMDDRVDSIVFEPGGTLLGTWEALWLFAGSVAKLVHTLPDGIEVRVLFRVPAEEDWLPLLPALVQDRVLPELCESWFRRTRRNRHLLQERFTRILGEMLGEHQGRVRVAAYDALHDIGHRLQSAVARGERPSELGLRGELSKTEGLWKFVLDPDIQQAVWSGLDAERRFAPEDLPDLNGHTGLVNAADVVNLLTYGRDGLAIVVDEASAARSTIGLADRFARLHPDGAARMMAIGPLGEILGETPEPCGPFSLFRGKAGHMVVRDPGGPSKGERVPTGDLFEELYFVR